MSSVDVMLRKKSEKSEANRIVRCFREHGQSRRLPQPQPNKPRSHGPQNGSWKLCTFIILLQYIRVFLID